MPITNIGCIYDLTTKKRAQLIVIKDGSEADLIPHKANMGVNQGWLDIDINLFKEVGADADNFFASENAIDEYIVRNAI